jgi:tRNA modification GTPase
VSEPAPVPREPAAAKRDEAPADAAPELELSTLVGVATGTPDGGVAIVRVSGPQAQSIVGRIVEGAGPWPTPPRQLRRRQLVVASGLEDALVVSMPGPRSWTGEDVVELHVHGGALNVREVVAALLAAGGVAAGPGDFSRRAFVHGRLSLDEAEGIAAVIAARTEAGLSQARRLVQGELRRDVEAVTQVIDELRVEIEANLDFPEDVDPGDRARWLAGLEGIAAQLMAWHSGFARSARTRTRQRVVLVGPPNAGKSALFNALLGHERALVSAIAGTTRDYVESELALGGTELTLVDTAGVRATDDGVEAAGISRSLDQIEGADVWLWVQSHDARFPEVPSAEDAAWFAALGAARARASAEGRVLEVETKVDLTRVGLGEFGTSAHTGEGIAVLGEAIRSITSRADDAAWIGLARHDARASEAYEAILEAMQAIADDRLEVAAFTLGIAYGRLREITGRHRLGAVGDDVLAAIFSRFCIGK